MKKIYSLCLFFALFAFSNEAFAQQNRVAKQFYHEKAVPLKVNNLVGNEVSAIPMAPSVASRFGQEEIVGSTWYDLQSNGTSQNRLIRDTDGTMHTVWTMSQDQGGTWPDRGTGYASHDGTEWSQAPLVKLESSARTGWPSISKTANGNIVILNHATSGDFRVTNLTLPAGSDTWQETDLPSGTPGGLLWPRSAAGGPDGNTIHAIAITTPTANNDGVDNTFQGVNGHIVYFRSLDGGATWDKQNETLPGIDNTEWLAMPADGYAIDVQGSTVAIGIFSGFGDVAVMKSMDNGETWTKMLPNDFPLAAYAADDGYTVADIYPDGVLPDDIPATVDLPDGDSLAIRTSDNSGSILIDASDMVHVWYGEQWVVDSDLTDGFLSFYNGNDAMRYWNESMGDNNNIFFAQPLDANGDEMLNILAAEVADYGLAYASMPTSAIDADGTIYLAYSGVTENFFDDNDAQHYRHVYLMRSSDNGATWTEPFDIVTEEFIPDLAELNETVFPSLARLVDDNIHLLLMRDFKPGLAVRGDEDALTFNEMLYFEIQKDLVSGTQEVVQADEIGFKVFPNPASQIATLQIELSESTNVNVSVVDLSGKVVRNINYSNLPRGAHQKTLNTSALQNGAYFIQVRTDDVITMQKLLVLN